MKPPFGFSFLVEHLAVAASVVLGLTMLAVLSVGRLQAEENPLPIGAAQREKLARLVGTDTEAAGLFKKFKRLADASLNDPPHPVERLATAGKLASDPSKVESRAALEDMRKLTAFGYAYAVTSSSAYCGAAKSMILAWARTYRPSGSPIDETKLEPLFITYGLTQQSFSPQERETVDSWLRLIVQQERAAIRADSVTAYNNWNSHRLNIVASVGWLLQDASLVSETLSEFKTHISRNLLPDGSSFDFHQRDALHYHCYDLEPLLSVAIAAHAHGIELYDYESASGASLRKSVRFLVPYCDGTATHAEWVHSKVEFDRARARAGEAKFETGANFDPHDALRVLELASFFDRDLKPLVSKLANRPGAQFPTWESVLNETGRP
jgi:hypothetical protein